MVGSHESQAKHPRRCSQETIGGVLMRKRQFLRASIASMSMTGETISPTISMLSDMEPIQLFSSASGDAGTTSASALPRRVTRSGVFVLFTSSSNDKHFALNLEIAISRIGFSLLFRIGIHY